MRITNTQPGPRGVNAVGGPVLIDPGQTIDVEVYAREKRNLDASGWFEVEGDYTPDPGALHDAITRNDNGDTPEMAQLRAMFDASYQTLVDRFEALSAEAREKDGTIDGLKRQIDDRDRTIADLRTETSTKAASLVLAMFEDPNVHFQTAKAEARKILGEATPETKDEIIAALQAKV